MATNSKKPAKKASQAARGTAKKGTMTSSKAPAKKMSAKKAAPTKKSAPKKATSKKTAPAKKAAVKKMSTKKATPTKKTATKTSASKKASPKKAATKKATAKKTMKPMAKKAVATKKSSPANAKKNAPAKATASKASGSSSSKKMMTKPVAIKPQVKKPGQIQAKNNNQKATAKDTNSSVPLTPPGFSEHAENIEPVNITSQAVHTPASDHEHGKEEHKALFQPHITPKDIATVGVNNKKEILEHESLKHANNHKLTNQKIAGKKPLW